MRKREDGSKLVPEYDDGLGWGDAIIARTGIRSISVKHIGIV